ncbi:HYPK_UBA domain-containing protein [Pycnococcus provasolii]
MAAEMDHSSQAQDNNAAETAQQMDRITDHVDDEDSSSNLDASKAASAANVLAAKQAKELEAQQARERELAAVKIDRSHVDVIADELLVDKKVAERRLREHGGDVVKAIRSYL